MQNKSIVWIWLPLGLIFSLMNLELPIISAVVARTPKPEINLASLGIATSIIVAFESPLMMILTSSIALANDVFSFRFLRKVTILFGLAMVSSTVLLVFTPIYNLLGMVVLNLPKEVFDSSRVALGILVFWPMAVAWRRLHQGLLVRHMDARLPALGTFIRISLSLSLTLITWLWLGFPGAHAAALGLVIAVTIEAVYNVVLAAPIVRRLASPAHMVANQLVSFGSFMHFYAPLSITTILAFLVQPIVYSGLTRTPNTQASLATWPIVYGLVIFISSFGESLQESTVSIMKAHNTSLETISKTALAIGMCLSILTAFFAFSPISEWFFQNLVGLSPELSSYAQLGMRYTIFIPALRCIQGLCRGILIVKEDTRWIGFGMFVGGIFLTLILVGGAQSEVLPGLVLGIISFTVLLSIDVLVLSCRLGRRYMFRVYGQEH